jgi:phosphatidylglycerophosphatase A
MTLPDKNISPITRRFVECATTFFYIGYLPLAPGSMASVAGAGLAFLLQAQPFWYGIVFLFVTWLGFKASGIMEGMCGRKDPGCIVIDEVSGMMLAFMSLPWRFDVFWATYFLFRAFDMFKIYPANRFEKIPGGTGIMMDDIMAGIYTNIVMQIVIRLAGIGG